MQPRSDPGAETDRDHLVVIGASAGGVETLLRVISGLPADLAASVCIVLHLAPGAPSALPTILQRRSRLPCRAAVDDEKLQSGEILVAPPDRHLTIQDGRVSLTVGPRENGHRPSVDALFRSAALGQDGKVIGVVLSGTRDDGTLGLAVIKAEGGQAIVQDPAEALYPGMPASAIAGVAVDMVVPSDEVADAIVKAIADPPAGSPVSSDPPAAGDGPPFSGNPGHGERPGHVHNPGPGGFGDPPEAFGDPDALGGHGGSGGPVSSTCPEGGGGLSERTEAGITQWQCRVGQAAETTLRMLSASESVKAERRGLG